ncbi:MAG: hypothetical protein N2170_05425 [Bacteroidia bacterium]|nr:hypothetical protein [Bacteroidia bacterium]
MWFPNGGIGDVLLIGSGGTPIWAPNPICVTPTLNRFIKFTSTSPAAVCNTTLAEEAAAPNRIWNADGAAAPLAADKFSIYAVGAALSAINGYSALANGTGVYGQATGTGQPVGVFGATNQANGWGVYGNNVATTGNAVGVQGATASTAGVGVVGLQTATSGAGVGVFGQTNSPAGYGGYFINNAAAGAGAGTGVFGRTAQSGGAGVLGQNTNGGGPGGFFVNTAAAGTAFGDGVFGQTAQSGGGGVSGLNTNANGTGVWGAGNNSATWYSPPGGAGGTFTGTATGAAGYATNGTGDRAGGLFACGPVAPGPPPTFFNTVRVAAVVGGTNYKVVGGGSVSTLVWRQDNKERLIFFCPEAPEVLFMDYGEGQLQQGRAYIELDPDFSHNIWVDDAHPLRVFIQLEGDCKGVYVLNKSSRGFEVRELDGGRSNARFVWQVVANRRDEYDPQTGQLVSRYQNVRKPVLPHSFFQVEPREKAALRLPELQGEDSFRVSVAPSKSVEGTVSPEKK